MSITNTKKLRLLMYCGIFIAETIASSPSTYAECNCWCLVVTGPGDSSCFAPDKRQQNNNTDCNSACKMTYGADYEDGNSWCGPTAEKDCRAMASPGSSARKYTHPSK